MKKTIGICTFLLFTFSGFTQVVDTAAVVREVDSLIKGAKVFYNKKQYKEMLKIVENALQLTVENIGKENEIYIRNLNYLAVAQKSLKEYEEAEKVYLECINLGRRALEKPNKDYANCLQNLANLYMDINRKSEAESLYIEARDVRRNIFGDNHEEYAKSLSSIGYYYKETERYLESIQNYTESKALWASILGKKSLEYAKDINNLAIVYETLGQYADSETLHTEALEIYAQIYGRDHLEYAKSLNNLAVTLYRKGDLSKSESLYMESKNIREKLLGKDHALYAQSLNNLSTVYIKMGIYTKAEKYSLEVLRIREKNMGKESLEYARAINNLGIVYYNSGQYGEAERCLVEAKNIKEKILGKDHLDYISSLENLGALYRVLNKFDVAETYYLECLSIREKKLGRNHVDCARALSNLGILHSDMKRFEDAEFSLLEALQIYENTVGIQHSDYGLCLDGLIILYFRTNQEEKFESLILKANPILTEHLSRASQHLSEREFAEYTLSKKQYFDRGNSYICQSQKQLHSISEISFDNALFQKELLLTFSNRIKIFLSIDSAISNKLTTLITCQHLLGQEYSKPIQLRNNAAKLEEQVNTLEKYLTRTVSGFGDIIRQVRWQEVQSALLPGEAAIEFVHFNYYNPEPTDSVLYAALLLKPGMQHPVFIPLCEEKQLRALLPAADDKLNNDQVNELYSNQELYRLLWSPLESHLSGVRKVYHSPSGLLHRLNLSALPASSKTVLSDRYDMVMLGSTRQLALSNQDVRSSEAPAALLYGGIQFDMDSTTYREQPADPTNGPRGLSFTETDSTLRGGAWNYLKWSEKEVENIQTALSKARIDAQAKKGWQATEESFKQIGRSSPSPRILHVSTHGFFFPDPANPKSAIHNPQSEEPVFKLSDHPMIRSGLILAGANHAWKAGRPLGNREDGILTAYEISQLDLRNTELVVLSACETGLGHIEGNEGVYGLQRAFKIAGAKTLVMSLWQVPDYQTQELMTVFYEKLLTEKLAPRLAMRAAQDEMRKRHYEPYYWAGFVVVE